MPAGGHGDWTYKITFQGQGVHGVYDLHWTFPPGSNTAPIDGTARIAPISGIRVHVEINNGTLKATASGNGFTGSVTSHISAKLVGSNRAPALRFVQSQVHGSISGFGILVPTSGAGAAFGVPIRLRSFPGCA
jgi:hypothetical protein